MLSPNGSNFKNEMLFLSFTAVITMHQKWVRWHKLSCQKYDGSHCCGSILGSRSNIFEPVEIILVQFNFIQTSTIILNWYNIQHSKKGFHFCGLIEKKAFRFFAGEQKKKINPPHQIFLTACHTPFAPLHSPFPSLSPLISHYNHIPKQVVTHPLHNCT